jgi:hypothetical protein
MEWILPISPFLDIICTFKKDVLWSLIPNPKRGLCDLFWSLLWSCSSFVYLNRYLLIVLILHLKLSFITLPWETSLFAPCQPWYKNQNIGKSLQKKIQPPTGRWWLKPIILATQQAEIRKIEVQSQPGQIVHKTLSRKINPSSKRAGGVTQGVGPEFKP